LANDQDLWEKISRGNAEAFDAFYRENAPRLVVFLQHVVGNRQAAERYCARNIHADMESAQRVSAERGPLRAYLYGIGRKRAAEWWRRQPQRKSEAKTEFEATVPHAEAASAVATRSRSCQRNNGYCCGCEKWKGSPTRKLAVILEIPVGTVRSRLFAAREALRGIWHSSPPNSKEGV